MGETRNRYMLLAPPVPSAIGLVRLEGPDVAAVFTKALPVPGDPPKYMTMRGVDSGLVRAAHDERSGVVSWLFTPHGGSGVMSALEEALRAAGFERVATPAADPEFAAGMNRYQRTALAMLPTASAPGPAGILVRAMNAPPPGPHGFDGARFMADWALVAPWLTTCRVALCGLVNAGKSTLFNLLASDARAIVHAEPGTTRDVIAGRWLLPNGCEVELLDTPGLRDWREALRTPSAAEREGISIGLEMARTAALKLVLAPCMQPRPLMEGLHVATMSDLGAQAHWADIALSAKTGAGIDRLTAAVTGHLFPELPDRLLPLSAEMALDAVRPGFVGRWFVG
jgi:hypothetical protein